MQLEEEGQTINDTIQRALAFSAENPEEPGGDEESDDPEEGAQSGQAQEESEEDAGSDDEGENDGSVDEDPDDDEMSEEEFAKLARKRGYTFERGDTKRVTNPERKALQAKMRQFREEREQFEQQLEEKVNGATKRFERALQIEEAIKADDMDTVARLVGYKDFLALNRAHVERVMSPEHKKIQQLEERERQRDAEAKAIKEKREAEARARQQQEAEEQYREEVGVTVAKIDGYEEWADDADFVNAVIGIQRQNYNPDEGTTVTIEEAAKGARAGAYAMLERLAQRFGWVPGDGAVSPSSGAATASPDSGASAETPTSGASAKSKKKPKNISQSETVDASAQVDTSKMSEEEQLQYYTRMLEQANRQAS